MLELRRSRTHARQVSQSSAAVVRLYLCNLARAFSTISLCQVHDLTARVAFLPPHGPGRIGMTLLFYSQADCDRTSEKELLIDQMRSLLSSEAKLAKAAVAPPSEKLTGYSGTVMRVCA